MKGDPCKNRELSIFQYYGVIVNHKRLEVGFFGILNSMNDCIFCKIVGDESRHVWSNEVAVAFKTIDPLAPVHVLVVPRVHVKNIDALDDEKLAGQMLMAVREVNRKFGIVEANKVMLQGKEIDHLHFHVMSDDRYGAHA
jgi:histidine triad (HIT) family protein